MNKPKRARQKANRASRIAAAQAAQAKARRRRRTNLTIAGVMTLLALGAGIFWLVNLGGNSSTVTTAPTDSTTTIADTTTTTEPTNTEPTTTEPTNTTEPPMTDVNPDAVTEPANPDCPAADHSSPRTIQFSAPQPMCINPALNYQATFDTSEGEIIIDLDTENTPNTVNNFATLARWGYYDNTELFRTDPSIDIIQGGSPTTNTASDPGPGYTIADEPTFTNTNGTLVGPYRYQPGQLVMARSAGPNSSGAQFFFTTGENTSVLDSQGTYIVFGTTNDAGLAVMQNIIGLHQPDDSGLGGRPSRTVTVNSVRIQVNSPS